jgi:hypothetical protein
MAGIVRNTVGWQVRRRDGDWLGRWGDCRPGWIARRHHRTQILHSYGDPTRDTNEAGAIYLRKAPDVNAATSPETWVTVVWNGVRVHDDVAITGPTGGNIPEGPATGSIRLQDHGNAVQYRNIWIEPLT